MGWNWHILQDWRDAALSGKICIKHFDHDVTKVNQYKIP